MLSWVAMTKDEHLKALNDWLRRERAAYTAGANGEPAENWWKIHDERRALIVAAKDDGVQFKEMSRVLGITQERVGKIYKKAKAEVSGVCPHCRQPMPKRDV